jgi:hypothetical protein
MIVKMMEPGHRAGSSIPVTKDIAQAGAAAIATIARKPFKIFVRHWLSTNSVSLLSLMFIAQPRQVPGPGDHDVRCIVVSGILEIGLTPGLTAFSWESVLFFIPITHFGFPGACNFCYTFRKVERQSSSQIASHP